MEFLFNLFEVTLFWWALTTLTLCLACFLAWKKLRKKIRLFKNRIFGRTELPHPTPSHKFIPFMRLGYVKGKSFSNQPLRFRRSVKSSAAQIGEKFERVIIVHGTFVGTDVFGVEPLLQEINSPLSRRILKSLSAITSVSSKRLASDGGRFSDESIDIITKNVGESCKVITFDWGSENHHAGRLRGFIKLFHSLSDMHSNKKESLRTLFIGHSHAAQIFALLSWLPKSVPPTDLKNYLIHKITNGEDSHFYNTHPWLRKPDFHFFTLGSPARYPWSGYPFSVHHLINHRGEHLSAIALFGFARARFGDYVQLWGVNGSDFKPASQGDLKICSELDTLLGEDSFNKKVWLKTIARQSRLHSFGESIFVDFEDNSLFSKSLYKNFFGHGVYMNKENLGYVLQVIAEHTCLND